MRTETTSTQSPFPPSWSIVEIPKTIPGQARVNALSARRRSHVRVWIGGRRPLRGSSKNPPRSESAATLLDDVTYPHLSTCTNPRARPSQQFSHCCGFVGSCQVPIAAWTLGRLQPLACDRHNSASRYDNQRFEDLRLLSKPQITVRMNPVCHRRRYQDICF